MKAKRIVILGNEKLSGGWIDNGRRCDMAEDLRLVNKKSTLSAKIVMRPEGAAQSIKGRKLWELAGFKSSGLCDGERLIRIPNSINSGFRGG